MTIDSDRIGEIHRLRYGEGWSLRRIAAHLHLGRETVGKYLACPWRPKPAVVRGSKLDPFKPDLAALLAQDGAASAVVLRQRLAALGYTGGLTILRVYLQGLRGRTKAPRAYVRQEFGPGERSEADWGHFGALAYEGGQRKLYAFVLVEAHSRMLYLEFTHSQTFETFARCLLHAGQFLGGFSREIWFDNLAAAVAEHDGRLVRFQPRFLAIARELGFSPRACNRGAAWEKGKTERGIGYVRQNFWPLRQFADLHDLNRQARLWLAEIANRRVHRETGQSPHERFQPEQLRPAPDPSPDCRETVTAMVHKDIRLHFDGNRYCVPPRYVGLRLTIRADAHAVSIYHLQREVAAYPRCWGRGRTFGAERFERELRDRLPAAAASQDQQRLAQWLGPAVQDFLRHCLEHHHALRRQVAELLALVRDYGPDEVGAALTAATAAGAFGADYVAGILRQRAAPRKLQPPVPLKDPRLGQLTPEPPSLQEYDALILTQRSSS